MEQESGSKTLWEEDQAETRVGEFLNEPMESYHASPGFSWSFSKEFSKTPLHGLIYKTKPASRETPAQRLGTAAHTAILEFDRFKKDYVVIEGHRGSTSVKAEIKAAEEDGKTVVKQDEYESAVFLAKAVHEHPIAGPIVRSAKTEVTLRWRDEETGVLLRCRLDAISMEPTLIPSDLKTFDFLDADAVQKQCYRLGYHHQVAFYLMGIKAVYGVSTTMFPNIFLDVKTYQCRVFVLDDASIEFAAMEMRVRINQYAACLKENKWPGYGTDTVTITLPSYAWRTE